MAFIDKVNELKQRKDTLLSVVKSGHYRGTPLQGIAGNTIDTYSKEIRRAENWIKSC